MKKSLYPLFITTFLMSSVHAGFFNEYEEELNRDDNEREYAAQSKADRQLSTSCPKSVKRRKIALILHEDKGRGSRKVNNPNYSQLFQEINRRLKDQGLRTYTQTEITSHIAQAELEAVANGDPDAAIAAAGKLGASYFLKARISSRHNRNPLTKVNEVFVDMSFTMTKHGRSISSVKAGGDSWAGQDTQSVALQILESKADTIVGQLYYDICTKK
ncbi:MAG: hypothetical protein HOM11_14345 [Methylococcales bacterium]|nr:hypothetical protein [Methylococcales bacterium]MBT7442762.1 hypothetical protein [Methylococcales bacterium]